MLPFLGRLYHLVLMCFTGSEAANILFLYFPLYSHMMGPLNVASELASLGHVVWNAVPTKLASDRHFDRIGVNTLIYKSLDKYDLLDELLEVRAKHFWEGKASRLPIDVIEEICGILLGNKDFLADVKKIKFDLVVFDSSPISRMLTIMAYKLDIPFIFMGARVHLHASRTPFVTAATPLEESPWTPVMDLGSRLKNSIVVMYVWFYEYFSCYRVEEYAPEKPYISLESLIPKALFWLIEIEPLLDYPHAMLPNVKFIGSLTTGEPKPLPKRCKEFMDDAKDGVVIVSFGTVMESIPDEITKRLVDAFSQTRYKFIFKTNKKFTVNRQILLTEWMPQSDLLAHPNTKLFITHCGANSQNEAFLRSVPMIGFPMFADQPLNAARLPYRGFGLKMDLKSFTVNELVLNINEVINNASYTKKIKKAAEITKLRQRTPKEEAVYWIEHVLQYGGDHLRSYCQDMPLYQYLNLDVIGVLFFLLHLTVYLIWKSCCLCIQKTFGRNKQKKD